MNRRIFTGIIVLAMLFAGLTGCGKPKFAAIDLKGDKTVNLKMGSMLEVKVKSNPTTGYTWNAADRTGSGAVKKAGHRFDADTPKLAGSGGTDIYYFVAEKKGTSEFTFEYKRTWEETEPAKTYSLTIVVD